MPVSQLDSSAPRAVTNSSLVTSEPVSGAHCRCFRTCENADLRLRSILASTSANFPPHTVSVVQMTRASRGSVGHFSVAGKDQQSQRNAWLGREDSNLRMAESKSAALPLGDAPRRADHNRRGALPQPARSCRAEGNSLVEARTPRYKAGLPATRPAFSRCSRSPADRSVAQPGSAPASGAGGRRFESSHSDHFSQIEHSPRRQRLSRPPARSR